MSYGIHLPALGVIAQVAHKTGGHAVTERDWTYRQLVYARNRLLEAAAQLDLAIKDRKQSAVRAAVAEGMAHRARRELARIWRRYEKERGKGTA